MSRKAVASVKLIDNASINTAVPIVSNVIQYDLIDNIGMVMRNTAGSTPVGELEIWVAIKDHNVAGGYSPFSKLVLATPIAFSAAGSVDNVNVVMPPFDAFYVKYIPSAPVVGVIDIWAKMKAVGA